MNFSFVIRYIKHTFFCIIGLCDIKVRLIKLKNFTQSFPHAFVRALVATLPPSFTCSVYMQAKTLLKKIPLKQ